MADRLDVAERLADGRAAVEHTQTYVRACRALGYQQPDLTTRPSQVHDWYDSEEGLDLRALDRDCAQLRAAAAAVEEGLRMQRAQLTALAAAWRGSGGDFAAAFLQRHCDTATAVATEVRAAAQRCESLRDNLWYLVDSKVATVVAVDDRTQTQRAAWLAAATAVITGAGERQGAEETVRQQIGPYVDNDIRTDWLTAMRSTVAGITASYDMVLDRMAAAPAVYFEVPGDFGAYHPGPLVTPAVAAVAPAAAVPDPQPAPGPPPAPAAATAPAPVPDLGAALGEASGVPAGVPAGDLGGGLGGLGGLSGLAGRIVDAMSGLLGSAADEFPGASDADPFYLDDTVDEDDGRAGGHDDEPADEAVDVEEADEDHESDQAPTRRAGPTRPASPTRRAGAAPRRAAGRRSARAGRRAGARAGRHTGVPPDRGVHAVRDRREPAAAGGPVTAQAGRNSSNSST